MQNGEKYVELIKQAKKEIDLADHLLYMTYPMIKETKFLLAISEHIIKASRTALEALLEFEHKYKRIEPFSRNFAVMISTYRQKLEKFYNLDAKFYRLLNKLNEIHSLCINSQVRFKRGEKFILANHDYKLTTIDFESTKRYDNLTKKFVEAVDSIVSKS